MSSLPPWKRSLVELILDAHVLTFGTFTLKSGRQSPYFLDCGRFARARLASAVAAAYARTLLAHADAHPVDFRVDVLFGPAYKGIPLAATATVELARLDPERWGDVGYAFNRKEAKGHGEGGTLVGEALQGKRVVVVDDVMTAGTAVREAMEVIARHGGTVVGVVVAVDRQEKLPTTSEKEGRGDDGSELDRGSAIGELRRQTGVPVLAVLTLTDIIAGMKTTGRHEEVERMEEYYQKYGARD